MLTDFRSLREDDRLSDAVDLILAGSQHDFPVLDGNRVAGLLTRTDLIAALSKHGPEYSVGNAMRQDYRSIDASDPLDDVFMGLVESQEYAIPVTQAGRLVGLLTADNLAEFFMLQSALEYSRQHKEHQTA
jgi:CBS domain-containing protein